MPKFGFLRVNYFHGIMLLLRLINSGLGAQKSEATRLHSSSKSQVYPLLHSTSFQPPAGRPSSPRSYSTPSIS